MDTERQKELFSGYPPVLTTPQIAKILQISYRTANRKLESGEIRATQRAQRGRWKITQRALIDYIEGK